MSGCSSSSLQFGIGSKCRTARGILRFAAAILILWSLAGCDSWLLFKPAEVSDVKIPESSVTLEVGDTEQLTATVTPANSTDRSVSWASSDAAVASVSSSGLVTAEGVGTATITVTTNDGNFAATCAVTVSASSVSVTGASLDKSAASLITGGTEQLTATVTPANSTDRSVSWASSDAAVASVSSAGLVTAEGVGIATITVTTNDGNFTATCAVTVDPSTTGTLRIENGSSYGLNIYLDGFILSYVPSGYYLDIELEEGNYDIYLAKDVAGKVNSPLFKL